MSSRRLPDGTITEEFPAHQSDFHHAEPVWEDRPGWSEDLSDVTEWDQLPQAARDYGLLYGLATMMMALLTGWMASVVFRRD